MASQKAKNMPRAFSPVGTKSRWQQNLPISGVLHSMFFVLFPVSIFPRRRESSRLATSLWEQAERSTAARRAEAVRLLDQAAERARVQLDALLQVRGRSINRIDDDLTKSLFPSRAFWLALLRFVGDDGGFSCPWLLVPLACPLRRCSLQSWETFVVVGNTRGVGVLKIMLL